MVDLPLHQRELQRGEWAPVQSMEEGVAARDARAEVLPGKGAVGAQVVQHAENALEGERLVAEPKLHLVEGARVVGQEPALPVVRAPVVVESAEVDLHPLSIVPNVPFLAAQVDPPVGVDAVGVRLVEAINRAAGVPDPRPPFQVRRELGAMQEGGLGVRRLQDVEPVAAAAARPCGHNAADAHAVEVRPAGREGIGDLAVPLGLDGAQGGRVDLLEGLPDGAGGVGMVRRVQREEVAPMLQALDGLVGPVACINEPVVLGVARDREENECAQQKSKPHGGRSKVQHETCEHCLLPALFGDGSINQPPDPQRLGLYLNCSV